MRPNSLLAVVTLVGSLCSVVSFGEQPTGVNVVGTAEVRVQPDSAVITIGITTLDADIAKAMSENDERAKRVMQVATDGGVAAGQARTTRVSVEPKYHVYVKGDREVRDFLGYEARRVVVLSLGDLSKYESLLKNLLSSGITDIGGVDFRNSQLLTHRTAARDLAVRAARDKAQALAGSLGVALGPPRLIEEQSPEQALWRFASNVAQVSERAAIDTPSMDWPGEITITASVRVVFELGPTK